MHLLELRSSPAGPPVLPAHRPRDAPADRRAGRSPGRRGRHEPRQHGGPGARAPGVRAAGRASPHRPTLDLRSRVDSASRVDLTLNVILDLTKVYLPSTCSHGLGLSADGAGGQEDPWPRPAARSLCDRRRPAAVARRRGRRGRSSAGPAFGGADHEVQPGENLTGIARRYGVTVADLARLNGLADPNHLVAGTRLRLPSRTTSRHEAAAKPARPPAGRRPPGRRAWPARARPTRSSDDQRRQANQLLDRAAREFGVQAEPPQGADLHRVPLAPGRRVVRRCDRGRPAAPGHGDVAGRADGGARARPSARPRTTCA